MLDGPTAGAAPPGLREADDIARVEIPIVSGTMVNIPASKGRNTRWNRCLTSAPRPLRWSSIALKKPLMTKNSGIRKPWIAEKTIPKAESCRRSVTIQYDGKKGNCQMSWTGDPQAAGCFLTPSTKTVPLMTSGRSVEPFNVRHFFDADSISLGA